MNLLLICIIIAMLPCFLLGALDFFYFIKKPKLPADESNRINNVVLWWIVKTRPELITSKYKFFKNDVMDNINEVEK